MLHHTSGKKTLFHMWGCIIVHILSYSMFLLNCPVELLIVESDSSWQESAAAVLPGCPGAGGTGSATGLLLSHPPVSHRVH